MTDRVRIDVISPSADAAAARDIVAGLAPGRDVCVLRGLWYPYARFDVECAASALFGRRDFRLSCLVDGLTGLASTAPRFEPALQTVPATDVLESSIDPGEAARAARRYLAMSLGRSFRTIADFRSRLDPRGTVYKLYWLTDLTGQRVLVDSVTGGWMTMSTRVA